MPGTELVVQVGAGRHVCVCVCGGGGGMDERPITMCMPLGIRLCMPAMLPREFLSRHQGMITSYHTRRKNGTVETTAISQDHVLG